MKRSPLKRVKSRAPGRKTPPQYRYRRFRQSEGIYLVELLVAMMLGAMLTYALLQTAGMSLRHATSTQNEVYANTIVRQLMEATRTTSYDSLFNAQGEHILLTNRTQSGQAGPTIRTEPLQLDTINKTWEFATENSRFRGQARYKIEAGPDLDTLLVTVTVSWLDSTRYDGSAGERTVSASTVVTKLGSGAWNL